jgi:hypothetical protein
MEKEVEGIVVDETRARAERRFLNWLDSRSEFYCWEVDEYERERMELTCFTWHELEDLANLKYKAVLVYTKPYRSCFTDVDGGYTLSVYMKLSRNKPLSL